ncbi:MAG: hypothetical protein O6924_12885 [Alphaproteobacteria bacterium]|nr:hypothetical protein [Alphaproteobacteria bacterium]
MDDDPLWDMLDIIAIDCNKFGASEATREADEEKRPVTGILLRVTHRGQDSEQVFLHKRLGAPLRLAMSTFDTALRK